jgi:hypothetical protein
MRHQTAAGFVTVLGVLLTGRLLQAAEASKPPTAKAQAAPVVAEGLILHLPFDEVQIREASGKDAAAVLHGSEQFSPGVSGSAIALDGVDDYVDAGKPAPKQGSITIAAWIKSEQVVKQAFLVTRSVWSPGAWALRTFYGKAGVEFGPGGGLEGKSKVCDGKWHHLLGVYDAKENKSALYVDGKCEATDSTKPPFKENGNQILIGTQPGDPAFFKGLIDEVRIYDRRLSDEEIKQLYEAHRPGQ